MPCAPPAVASRSRRFPAAAGAFTLIASVLLPLAAEAAATEPDSAAADTAAPVTKRHAATDHFLAQALVAAGLENVTALRRGDEAVVAFENRHFRHSSSALGVVARAAAGRVRIFERRWGLVAAAIQDPGDGSVPRDPQYPSDGDFRAPPPGPEEASTRRNVDLLVTPLFAYELGGIIDPELARLELQPELRYNPWPGARLRAAVVIPVRDRLGADEAHPDVGNVRPGPVSLDQFGWSPGAALVSGTVGLLGNSRYGLSVGIARPLRAGELLLDAQTDVTGFVAFGDSGVSYSTPDRWSGFAGVTYRPAGLDLGVRLRVARFLHGDQGIELEVKRAMGDLDVAFFTQRIQGFTIIEDDGSRRSPWIGGVRLVLPVPPLERPVGWPIRVLPVDRWPLDYREQDGSLGQDVSNVASRENYLRQLDRPALEANGYRYRAARTSTGHRGRGEAAQWVSLTGMTGFITTPWCGVIRDREVELGYNRFPKEAAYEYRDRSPNDVYYAALGFLPHLEVGLRWTVMPGAHPFKDLVPESKYVDSDRTMSARVEVLEPRAGRPGFGIGVEDARGTRRFHSTYGVLGLPFDIYHLQSRVSLGYAPSVFEATRRTLKGLFGACEVSVRRSVAVALEHDTEKWNTMLGINLGFGLRARIALLDLEHLSLGAGWFNAL